MQTELYSLSKIFTENVFRIPDYQRGYSWGDRQLKDFWSDIALLDPNRDHYTGVLTLEEVPSQETEKWSDDRWIFASKRYKPYYVVDGQQRLTTSLLLLQCILERAGADGELNYSTPDEVRKKYIFESRDKGVSRSYIFGYEKDNPSHEYLKTKIFMEPSDSHSTGEETIYTQNLSRAKLYFAERLAPLDTAQLENVYTKITQHFLYNIYVISGEIDVFVAFETMNNRGKPLSHLELLKNRLIFLSTRFDVDDDERSKLRRTINESWKTAYHFLGRNQKRPLEDDHFLATQFLLYLGAHQTASDSSDDEKRRRRQVWRMHHRQDEYKSYLLDQYFTSRNLIGSKDAVVELQEPTDKNDTIVLKPESLYEYAHHLKRCVETYYRALNPEDSEFFGEARVELARIRRIGMRDCMPIIIAAVHSNPDEAVMLKLLRNLERFLFVRLVQMHYPDDELDLLELSVQLTRRELTVDALAEKIHLACDRRTEKLDISNTAVRWTRERAYYGWPGLKYFLFEYEQDLKLRSRSNRDKVVWDEFIREDYEKDYSTIEHIYPQKPKDSYWSAKFAGMAVKQKNALRNSLGNLLGLSRPKNSALGNRAFPEKRDGNADAGGYRFGSYSEIEVANEVDWTPAAILQRGLRLLDFMERRWGVRLGTHSDKVASLKLSFVEGNGQLAEGTNDEDDEAAG